jgi:periplasmic divalent cation tolerance protein
MANAPTQPITIFYCPCPSIEQARQLATELLKARLVACANLLSPAMESYYWWEGKIEHSTECVLLLKTTPELLQETRDFLALNHPYTTPCILHWDAQANPAFIKWVKECTKTVASDENMQ